MTSRTCQYKASSIDELKAVAESFIKEWRDYKIIALVGDMGAGKTTFVKAICDVLKVQDVVSSPTFSIVNEYTLFEGETLYHFDFYRIEEEQEALDFGVEEYWDSGNYCLMEWPQKVENLLPENTLEVNINVTSDETRILSVKSYFEE